MASKTKGQAGYGMGETVTVTRADVWDLNAPKKPTRRDPLDHPLFKGISTGARQQLRDVVKEITVKPGDRLTHHAIAEGEESPQNRLFIAGEQTLKVDIAALSRDPETIPGEILGRGVELDGTNFSSWFGGATGLPQVRPGLDVRVSKGGPQRVYALSPLPKLFDHNDQTWGLLPEDVEILLKNAGAIFGELLDGDNQADATGLKGYRPHEIPAMRPEVHTELSTRSGQKSDLAVNRGFAPTPGSKATAYVIEGSGLFFDRGTIEARGLTGKNPLALQEADVNPLARLGGADGKSPSKAFAFQWAGLDPSHRATALFIPTESGTTLTTYPLSDLLLRHMVVRSIAETAASMHKHVHSEAERLEAEKPVLDRLKRTILGFFGQNS